MKDDIFIADDRNKRRLSLRALEPEDAEFMYLAENEYTALHNSDNAAPYSRQILREYALNYDADPFRSGQLRLIAENEHSEPIGIVDFYDISARDRHASIAILILPEYRSHGLATEMIATATSYAGKTLGLTSIAAFIHTDNIASYKAFLHNGYVEAGRLGRWHFSEGILKDIIIMQHLSTQVV